MKKTVLISAMLLVLAVISPFIYGLNSDANHDGIVDLEDMAVMSSEWLTEGGYISPDAKIDTGFYAGSSDCAGVQTKAHNLDRVPDFVIIFPVDNAFVMHPVVLINNDTDECTEICRFNGTVSGYTDSLLTSSVFPVINYVGPRNYWFNDDETVYFYIAVNKEIPAIE